MNETIDRCRSSGSSPAASENRKAAWIVQDSDQPGESQCLQPQGYALAQLSVVITSRGQREADVAVATQIGAQ